MYRLDPELPAPAYAHEGDAGADLYARTGTTIRLREAARSFRQV